MTSRTLRILGIRGVPAAHGGFETFAERLALHLVAAGWRVVVYCQAEGSGAPWQDRWAGVERVHIPVASGGPGGTMWFDWLAIRHAARDRAPCLTLGYNTALFCTWLRLRRVPNVINMDGIEWRRDKWGAPARAWFWLNDWAGCWIGDRLVADNPGIADHLATRGVRARTVMIPYGADALSGLPVGPLERWSLRPGRYWMVVARPEPENSILEIVRAFSRRPRGLTLMVLGRLEPEHSAYHRAIVDAASSEVRFAGAVYEPEVVQALRFHAQGYIHGHRVGGTNPSLVEAMGAGNPVLAHDNVFNRWVAGETARYFGDEDACAAQLDDIVDRAETLAAMRAGIVARHARCFTWRQVLSEYEALLSTL